MDLTCRWPQCAARRDPVEYFDPLRARQPHHFMDGIAGQGIGIAGQIIEAEYVVIAIHKARALAIELVRQAARAHDHDPLRSLPALQRAVD